MLENTPIFWNNQSNTKNFSFFILIAKIPFNIPTKMTLKMQKNIKCKIRKLEMDFDAKERGMMLREIRKKKGKRMEDFEDANISRGTLATSKMDGNM